MMEIRVLPTHIREQQAQAAFLQQVANNIRADPNRPDEFLNVQRVEPAQNEMEQPSPSRYGNLFNDRVLREAAELSAMRRRHHLRLVEENKRSALEESPDRDFPLIPPMDASRFAQQRGLRNPDYAEVKSEPGGAIVPYQGGGSTHQQEDLEQMIAELQRASGTEYHVERLDQLRQNISGSQTPLPADVIQPKSSHHQPQSVVPIPENTPGEEEDPTANNEASVAQEKNEKSDEHMNTASPVRPEPNQ